MGGDDKQWIKFAPPYSSWLLYSMTISDKNHVCMYLCVPFGFDKVAAVRPMYMVYMVKL